MSDFLILNPYGADTKTLSRVQAWVSPDDRLRLRSVSPVKGFEQFAVCTFYKSLTQFINDNGLDVTNSKQLHDFILGLPSVISDAGKRHFQNVSGGVKPVCNRLADVSSKSTHDVKGSARGPRTGRGRGDTGNSKAKEVL